MLAQVSGWCVVYASVRPTLGESVTRLVLKQGVHLALVAGTHCSTEISESDRERTEPGTSVSVSRNSDHNTTEPVYLYLTSQYMREGHWAMGFSWRTTVSFPRINNRVMSSPLREVAPKVGFPLRVLRLRQATGLVSMVCSMASSFESTATGDQIADALLEDLQTGVSRPSSTVTMNGLGTGTRAYRQEIRTIQQHTSAVPDSGQYVQYLSASNPTTVVSERSISPGTIALQVGVTTSHAGDPHNATAYKTVSYQYNTRDIQQPIETRVIESSSDPASDARLRQNLTELDSLLVDLHQAQKTGFSTNQGGAVPGARSGIDPGLLESIDISPDPPARQQSQPKQHVSRTIEQRTYTTRYNDQPASPRLQPKRSSSAQRELTYGIIESGRSRSGRSPSPVRQSRDSSDSPRVPQRSPAVHREVYYETKTSGNSVPASPPRTHYRDKSPSNQRLHRELYYENNRTTSPSPTRYREPSPPPQRRGASPIRQSQPDPYPGSTGTKITTVRTYNYNTTNTGSAPSPVTLVRESPYPERTSPVVEVPKTQPYRSPSPVQHQSPSSPTKVTTTVRTYTYELPGDKPRGDNYPYPSGGDPNKPHRGNYPYPLGGDPNDHPLTYKVSPQPERDPLIGSPDPTVITYKYSSHSSRSTNAKFPVGPDEDREPLLPQPFPTASPSPVPPQASQPPKRLDDLMASFSDIEVQERYPQPPTTYHVTERHVTSHNQHGQPYPGPQGGEVAVVTPTPTKKVPPEIKRELRGQSKNVAGPAVYYPPGVELFANKDQSMQMASMKGSGKYEYEMSRESKDKSSSGGAAVVPVCLPLCCAMPCVIM
uniref:Uncharacterized protein n=1 Tax=Timema monikensis TaxID=170555 RepID=A0A7R9DYH7_9NEOP|nr:unnamed protein product [Timema monikensis]